MADSAPQSKIKEKIMDYYGAQKVAPGALVGTTTVPQYGGDCAMDAPQQVGLHSAVQELLAVASVTVEASAALKSCLGISAPKPGGEANQGASSNLLGAILHATNVLRRANLDFEDCQRHIAG